MIYITWYVYSPIPPQKNSINRIFCQILQKSTLNRGESQSSQIPGYFTPNYSGYSTIIIKSMRCHIPNPGNFILNRGGQLQVKSTNYHILNSLKCNSSHQTAQQFKSQKSHSELWWISHKMGWTTIIILISKLLINNHQMSKYQMWPKLTQSIKLA